MTVADFVYNLPEHLIAQHPAHPRGSSRLLVPLPELTSRIPLHQHLRSQARIIAAGSSVANEDAPAATNGTAATSALLLLFAVLLLRM